MFALLSAVFPLNLYQLNIHVKDGLCKSSDNYFCICLYILVTNQCSLKTSRKYPVLDLCLMTDVDISSACVDFFFFSDNCFCKQTGSFYPQGQRPGIVFFHSMHICTEWYIYNRKKQKKSAVYVKNFHFARIILNGCQNLWLAV